MTIPKILQPTYFIKLIYSFHVCEFALYITSKNEIQKITKLTKSLLNYNIIYL